MFTAHHHLGVICDIEKFVLRSRGFELANDLDDAKIH